MNFSNSLNFYTCKTLSDADSDGENLLENRKQLTGYSVSMMEVAKWRMNAKKIQLDCVSPVYYSINMLWFDVPYGVF